MPDGTKKGKNGKAKKHGPAAEPLPFTRGEALTAFLGCDRIVVPSKLDGRRLGQLATLICHIRTLERLRLVITWLNAGGEGYRRMIDLDALVKNRDTWTTAAEKWLAAGRPPLDRPGATPGKDPRRGICVDDA